MLQAYDQDDDEEIIAIVPRVKKGGASSAGGSGIYTSGIGPSGLQYTMATEAVDIKWDE